MTGSGAPEGELDVDLLAASLRADASDLAVYTEALATKLSEALPGGVQVRRARGRMFGAKRVERITVDAGDERLELRVTDAGLQTTSARLSGGIVLKTEPVDPDEWLRRLSEALAVQARRSQTTRQALARLLNA